MNKLSKNEIKHLEVQKKLNSLITNDYYCDDGSQNMFVYQPKYNVLKLKTDKGTEYMISWKSTGIYNSKLIALHGGFLFKVKDFKTKI